MNKSDKPFWFFSATEAVAWMGDPRGGGQGEGEAQEEEEEEYEEKEEIVTIVNFEKINIGYFLVQIRNYKKTRILSTLGHEYIQK